jgi:hypothetical protein
MPTTTPPNSPALEQRQPGRAQVIAAIHAYADFLADHPDLPIPHKLEATHYLSSESRDPAANRAMLHGFARRESIEVTRQGATLWAELVVCDSAAHGLQIMHTVFA